MVMSFSEKVLSKSNSYVFYKEGYEELLKKDRKNQGVIRGKQNFINKQKEKAKLRNEEIRELKHQLRDNEKQIAKLDGEIETYQKTVSDYDGLLMLLKDSLEGFSNISKVEDIRNINIAYVLNGFPEHSQTFILSELRWLVENDYNVVVFYRRDPYKPIDLDFDIKSEKFTSKPGLAKLLIEYDIDLMHTHFVYPICTNFTYPVSEILKIPFTVFSHAYDIFQKDYAEINNIGEISSSQYCLGIFTLSDFHKSYLIEQGASEDKIIITKQASDYELAEFSQKTDKIKNVVAISRFVEKKGLDVLIEASKLLEDEDLTFEIYGFGELEEELEGKIKELDCKNISLKGQLGHDEVGEKLKGADLLVAPCKVAENGDMDGIPTILFESMAVGLPVITTTVSAIPEVIRDGENGFLVEPDNPQLLADKIKEVVLLSSDDLHNICVKAQEDVKDISSVEKTMNTYLQNIEKI